MADVLNRITLAIRRSVHTPDFSTDDWVINPDFRLIEGIDPKYWKLIGDILQEMSREERAVVDAEELRIAKLRKIQSLLLEATNFIKFTGYPVSAQISAVALMVEAIDNGFANRELELKKIHTFSKEIMQIFHNARKDVVGARNIEDVEAITQDFTALTIPTVIVAEQARVNN